MEYCCEEFKEYGKHIYGLNLALYNPETKVMELTTHGEYFKYSYCPFCGKELKGVKDERD